MPSTKMILVVLILMILTIVGYKYEILKCEACEIANISLGKGNYYENLARVDRRLGIIRYFAKLSFSIQKSQHTLKLFLIFPISCLWKYGFWRLLGGYMSSLGRIISKFKKISMWLPLTFSTWISYRFRTVIRNDRRYYICSNRSPSIVLCALADALEVSR